jgi:hypothetical protein
MNETLLYTVPQWLTFAAIFMMVYGWIEDKKAFRMIGSSIFILLGLFSVFVFSKGYLEAGKFLTPDEIASQELGEETIEKITILSKLGPAYVSFLISSLLAIPALFFDFRNKKIHRVFMIVAALVALAGFFVIVSALKYV